MFQVGNTRQVDQPAEGRVAGHHACLSLFVFGAEGNIVR
jgi:hypothetical protein